jgi:hypothetical protein
MPSVVAVADVTMLRLLLLLLLQLLLLLLLGTLVRWRGTAITVALLVMVARSRN